MKLTQDLLNGVKTIAKAAGRAIMEYYRSPDEVSVNIKLDETPVTEADIAAHKIIKLSLERLIPGVPVLSEEAANIPFTTRSQWQRYWLVDPLDGTKEFIHRTNDFTVNIALIEDNQPILGVIYAPVWDVLYYAIKGQGAYKQTTDHDPYVIQTRAVAEKNFVMAVSRRHGRQRVQQFIDHYKGHASVVSRGSSLKSCLIAEGDADLYPCLGKTSEWDMAAAQCIVEEAGGMMINLELQPLRYNTKQSLLNPPLLVVGDKDYDWQQCIKTIRSQE